MHAAEAERQRDIQDLVSKALAAASPVTKAKPKNDQCAVYDADGNLVGTCDPDDITMVAAAKAPDGPASPPTDLTPAPPASVGTPADAVPAAKSMSAGVRGQQQLGGANPPGGVPTVPAEDADETEEVTKARIQQVAAGLKKSLVDGGRSGTATEAAAIGEAMNRHLIAKFEDMQRRGHAPGTPRRP